MKKPGLVVQCIHSWGALFDLACGVPKPCPRDRSMQPYQIPSANNTFLFPFEN